MAGEAKEGYNHFRGKKGHTWKGGSLFSGPTEECLLGKPVLKEPWKITWEIAVEYYADV